MLAAGHGNTTISPAEGPLGNHFKERRMNWIKEPTEKPEISEKQKENGVIELELCRCGEWAEVSAAT